VPNVKSITFHRDESVEIKLLYDPPVEGFEALLGHYYVQNVKSAEPERSLKVRLHLTQHNVIEFESAVLNEDFYVETLEPVKEAPKEAPKDAPAPTADGKPAPVPE